MKGFMRSVVTLVSFIFVAAGASFLSHFFGSAVGNGDAREVVFIPEAHADDPEWSCDEHPGLFICATGTTDAGATCL